MNKADIAIKILKSPRARRTVVKALKNEHIRKIVIKQVKRRVLGTKK
ncbi:MAG TPA: hypothetical protein VFJ72_05335 [Rubrobacteraceae bacterium]|nr:hypothetical protein [Rubrobacteraceae bacterium]